MTLSAIHLVDEGVFLLTGSYGYQYEVAGMPVPTNKEFVVSSLDEIVRVETRHGAVVAWRDAEGNSLPIDDYTEQLAALRKGASMDDDGDWVFPNLDAEFECRKFLARWKTAEYSPATVTRTPIEAEVSEVRVRSGDDDIVSLWNSPNTQNDARLYKFWREPTMVREAIAQCTAAGLVYDNTLHPSYLRFAKIDGDYAFDDSFDLSKRPFIGTLEQCKTEKALCIERVSRVLRVRAAKKKGVSLKNAGDTAISLRNVHRQLLSVSPKTSSASALSSARKSLADVISAIEADIT